MLEIEGTVHGRRVDLDMDIGLPDGARVKVTIDAASLTREQKLAIFASVFGSCAGDPTFAQAVAEVEALRDSRPPRNVEL